MTFSPQTTEIRLNNLEGQKTMTKAQHTPGPWHYSPYPESSGFAIGAKGLRSVAITTGKSLDCLRDENEANARLIAASPVLLDFAYATVSQWQAIADNEALPLNFRTEAQIYADNGRAAIAKAEGSDD